MPEKEKQFSKIPKHKKAKRIGKQALALATVVATGYAGVAAVKSAAKSEGFEKWNKGPALKVSANTPSKVVGHRIIHTNASTVFDHPIPEVEIVQDVKTSEGVQPREDWVEVSYDDYDKIHDGDQVTVHQLDPHWSNELQKRQIYDISEIK